MAPLTTAFTQLPSLVEEMGMEIVQLTRAARPRLPVQTLLLHPAVPVPPKPQHLLLAEADKEAVVVGGADADAEDVDAGPSRGEIIDLHSHLSARRCLSFGTRCTLVVHSPLHSFFNRSFYVRIHSAREVGCKLVLQFRSFTLQPIWPNY